MNMNKIYVFLSTLGPIGYMEASGTMATLVTIPLVYWLRTTIANEFIYCGIIAIIFLVSLFIVRKALHALKRTDEDPSEIVLDEVVGCMITFCGIAVTTQNLFIGFVLFRFFDIFKFSGIKYVERFHGEWGVMLDDIVAALMANIILRFLM